MSTQDLRRPLYETLRHAPAKLAAMLPSGGSLALPEWRRRHRAIVWLLWAHVVGVEIYGLIRGFSFIHVSLEVCVMALCAHVANRESLTPKRRSIAASIGLMTASAELVHLSGGLIEMHFHFFVMVAVIALYQDWLPFLLAVSFVLVHHAVMGTIDPRSVYDNPAAIANPWLWAAIHAGFVLAESVACLVWWKLAEEANVRQRSAEAASRATTEQLARNGNRFRALLQNASDAVLLLDAQFRITYVSESAGRVLGRVPGELIGGSFPEMVHQDDLNEVLAQLEAARTTRDSVASLEHRFSTAGGSWFRCETVVANLLDNPSVEALVLTTRDVTVRRDLEDQLRVLAYRDPLTGLANRHAFLARVEDALSRRDGGAGGCTVLFLDLDNFKTVNDSLGHPAGDSLLWTVARRIEANVRPHDVVARLGGDEFAVLIPDILDLNTLIGLAERLLAKIHEPVLLDGTEILPQASLGVSLGSGPAQDVAALLRDADAAMYEAKRRGKGCYQLFRPELLAGALARLELEADLRRAIAEEEFVIRYQPVVTLGDGELAGVEALIRWEHPQRGLLSPAEFIEVAEETGLIVPIGRWMLQRACEQMVRLQRRTGSRFHLNVNLSSRQIAEDGFEAEVAAVLASTGMDPACLVLEITETVLMNDADETVGRMRRLHELGVRFAMDDFGTGYSSLAYLRRFPIQVLKIDRAFVSSMGDGVEELALVRAIISLAETFGMEVVAEGVEHQWQATRLFSMGCGLGQGYFFDRPLSIDALEARVSRPPLQRRPLVSASLVPALPATA
ncbi:MAG TPA: EAL domain-containing protein [Actinomycetota bacterium]|nr:EAL domain-containing protein [Actinomycetota bacterium]